MVNLKVPTLVVVLGEGGSGGALAIGMGDRVLMLENAVYSVITPEGCAAILWKDATQADRAAESLRLTANDMERYNLIDEVIEEPIEWKIKAEEGSDKDINFIKTGENLSRALVQNLRELEKLDAKIRMKLRFEKFRNMGEWVIK
jgi:acetyl-CoA carboxylase carboxyl transferase subunit alpha